MNNRLSFGTAGIRGIVGKGMDKLNLAYVFQIVSGFARYINNEYKNLEKKIVIIGRDNRRMSKEFAQYAANILADHKINVLFSENICPTPFVSYCILKYYAIGGINITASHNPKEYNGIKLYNQWGGQCLPNEINKIMTYFDEYDKQKEDVKFCFKTNNFIKFIPYQTFVEYYNEVLKIGRQIDFSQTKIIYSPLHGTGLDAAEYIRKKYYNNDNFLIAPKQRNEDAEFSFCKNPNPETTEAYEELIELNETKNFNADALIVTDPDSDRVGVVIKKNNQYYYLNGNETATIIFDYLIKNQPIKKNSFLAYSYVSTNLPAIMARKNNIKVFEVPTGFKWISMLIQQNQELELFYGFEESYGSLIKSNLSRDKDAIQSLVTLLKVITYYKNNNLDLIDVLNQIYKQYGYITSKTININLDFQKDANLLQTIQERFKKLNFKNATLIDFNQAQDYMKSNMLKYQFKDNSWIALRPSGTEPKIKFYIFAYGKDLDSSNKRFIELKTQIDQITKK